MTLNDLLIQIEVDHEKMVMKALVCMPAKDCFKKYTFHYQGQLYKVNFNLLTLDFTTQSKMTVLLRSKLKSKIIKAKYLKWKFKKEGRAFFDFLKLYYRDYGDVIITDSESPDFIVHDEYNHGYEITEATDRHNAKFNETIYLLTGMDQNTNEYQRYIKQIEKTLTNKKIGQHIFQERHAKNIERIQNEILECILKKVEKYKTYEAELDTRNIIVFNNRIGFRRQSDFDKICYLIKSHVIIGESNIDRIFVISGTQDVMIELDKYGALIKIKRKR